MASCGSMQLRLFTLLVRTSWCLAFKLVGIVGMFNHVSSSRGAGTLWSSSLSSSSSSLSLRSSPSLIMPRSRMIGRSTESGIGRKNGVERNYQQYLGREDDDTIIPTETFDEGEGGFDHSSDPDFVEGFRSGYVAIVGAPNMGKSTLMNALLEETLCVSTPRPQTTRHAILGVLTDLPSAGENGGTQICFLDTPGTIPRPAYALQEGMMEAVAGAFRDADLLLVVDDITAINAANIDDNDDEMGDGGVGESAVDRVLESVRRYSGFGKPVLVALNKLDKLLQSFGADSDEAEAAVDTAVSRWRDLLPDAVAVFPCSAAAGPEDPGVSLLRSILLATDDVPARFRSIGRPRPGTLTDPSAYWLSSQECRTLLPQGPLLYPPDTLTDRPQRFWASEIVRGCLMTKLAAEVPYCCEVRIVDYRDPDLHPEDNDPATRITAEILVERESQVGIVVGKGGSMIRKVGTDARQKLMKHLGTSQLHLNLSVAVEKDWRRNRDRLKQFGY